MLMELPKNPIVTVKTGRDAELKPIIVDGRILDVQVLNRGRDYFSLPSISVETTGITTSGLTGSGAILRPVINDGKLTDVVVINSGIGYTASQTNLYV